MFTDCSVEGLFGSAIFGPLQIYTAVQVSGEKQTKCCSSCEIENNKADGWNVKVTSTESSQGSVILGLVELDPSHDTALHAWF